MIVLFNGPPGSGKDDACGVLVKYGFTHLSFAHELLKSVVDYFNVDYDWFMEGYNIRDIKENYVESSLGLRTRRQAMIYVAEDVMKPLYGKNYYADQVVKQINKNPKGRYCISDLGYHEELETVVDAVSKENVAVIQLVRRGYDFSSDKRKYIGGENSGIMEFPVYFNENEKSIIDEPCEETRTGVRIFRVYNNDTLDNFHRSIHFILFILLEEGHYYESSL